MPLQQHYGTLLRLKRHFPFSLIDACGTLEQCRAQIARELRCALRSGPPPCFCIPWGLAGGEHGACTAAGQRHGLRLHACLLKALRRDDGGAGPHRAAAGSCSCTSRNLPET